LTSAAETAPGSATVCIGSIIGRVVDRPAIRPILSSEVLIRVSVLWSTVLIVACPVVCAAQTSSPASEYVSLVRAYRQRNTSTARSLQALPRERLNEALNLALSSQDAAGLSWQELRAAAILHSEAAVLHWQGRAVADASVHVAAAQRLLDRVVELERPQDDFRQRWYDLMIGLAFHFGPPKSMDQLREASFQRWGQEPAREHFARGLEAETRGSVEHAAIATQAGPARAPLFGRAAREYEEALKRDPRLHTAALHLGRIRLIQNQLDAAVPLLRQCQRAVDPRVAYLATLFLGAIEERRERFKEAEAYYRDALRHYPEGQSAPLALAQLLSRTGREVEARAAVVQQLDPKRDYIVDPLWTYLSSGAQEVGARLQELRVEVWR
jgi:tetratricopeptide (TPR) repeat protein